MKDEQKLLVNLPVNQPNAAPGNYCRAVHPAPRAPYRCTLAQGHDGDHTARGIHNEHCAAWPQS